jgi:hypothetical protein
MTDNTCATSTVPVGGVTGAVTAPVPGAVFSTVSAVGGSEPSTTDTAGWFFDIDIVAYKGPFAPFFEGGALKSCSPDCGNAAGVLENTPSFDSPPPTLTTAFITACHRSIKGVDGVETLADCSTIGAAPPAPPGITSNTGGGGGGARTDERRTTTNSEGSTIIVAPSPTQGAGTARRTTTDAEGSTIIVGPSTTPGAGSAGYTTATVEGSAATVAGDQPSEGGGGGGSNLHLSTNFQGQTFVVAEPPSSGDSTGPPGGQITLIGSNGATVVIQGASLASSNSGSGLIVTDGRSSIMFVQGGVTGTLSFVSGGGTMLIAGTTTQTSWVAGATISVGESGSGAAQPTVQSKADLRRAPFLLFISASLFLATTIALVIL